MAFVTDNNATALIPTRDAQEIIRGVAAESAAMNMFRTINMGTRIERLPVVSALAQASFVSGPSGSNPPGRKPTSSAAWERKVLTAEEIAVIIPIAEDTIADSAFDVWAELRPQIVESIGAVVDAAVFFGVNKPASWTDPAIVAGAAAAGNQFVRGSVAGQLLDVDISDTFGLVEADGYEVNGAVARPGLRAALRGLRDANGQPVYIVSPRNDNTTAQGAQIYDVNASFLRNGSFDATAAELIAGDMRRAILGIRQDIRFKMLDQAVIQDVVTGDILYNLAQQDMVAMRVTFRLAYCLANPINRMNPNGATRFPFGVLRPVGFVV